MAMQQTSGLQALQAGKYLTLQGKLQTLRVTGYQAILYIATCEISQHFGIINMLEINKIYQGDCLEIIKDIDDKSIDLVYLDPPFFSNKNYEVIFNDGEEIRSFEDRWRGGINHYIEWMRDRVFELHRTLKDTGSFYLHCDWHASHYLKVMCDEIFGYKNFLNEIIWS